MSNTDKDNNIPEKWRISCPLDHSTLEKFTNCDCNYGGARDVWWFKEQQIHSLKAELEKASELIKESKYLIDRYSSDTPLDGVVDCCNNYNLKANEFLKIKEGE